MSTSYNGWTASPNPAAINITPLVVNDVKFPNGVKAGSVHTVFTHLVKGLMRVEAPITPGCWGYAYRQNRNASNLSCHASGTAIDYNAPGHPNGVRGTWSALQVRAIRVFLAELEVVAWGEDFTGTPDGMHFEIKGTAAQVAAVAVRLSKPAPTPAPVLEDDDMAVLVSADGVHFVTDYLTKRPVHSADEERALRAAGVKPVSLPPAAVRAIRDN